MNPKVYFDGGAVYCAAGDQIEALWQCMATGQRNLADLPCPAFDTWPWPQVFMVEEPAAAALKVDRKLLRTMEKQAKLGMYGAALALRDSPLLALEDKSRFGLYLGLPTVDEPVPPWELMQSMHDNGDTQFTSEILHREIPAFFGLSTLNSNVCAQIAGTFGMTGAIGAYSPFADAGLQAIIEAALSIINGENTVTLAGGISAKVNPLLMLQYEHFGWTKDLARIPGEGAAYVLMHGNADTIHSGLTQRICLASYARGFVASPEIEAQVQKTVLQTALAKAGLSAKELDWILPNAINANETAVLQELSEHAALVFGNSADVCGALGAAGPVVNILLAMHAMQQQKRLCFHQSAAAQTEQSHPIKHVLVTASGPEGQYVAVILSLELP